MKRWLVLVFLYQKAIANFILSEVFTMTDIQKILISRRMLVADTIPTKAAFRLEGVYLNAFLLSNFGIAVDKPELLTKEMVKDISDVYKLDVPASYFKNPQDTRFYTADELLIEQCISYFFAYGADDSHVHIFDKELPEYPVGDEIKIREFKILDVLEASNELIEITRAYAAYKRPWGLDEQNEFLELYKNDYYGIDTMPILCGDNAVFMLDHNTDFGQFLFKKDVVKLSITKAGEKKELTLDADTRRLIKAILPLVKDCPMSKKQAKYFNKLVQITGVNVKKTSNKMSPNKLALEKLEAGDVLAAAEIFAKSGSLLERNLKFLLSRANPVEAVKVLDMLSDKNPVVLHQLMSTITADTEDARTFSFYAKNKIKTHVETDYEARWRKSRLNDATKKLVHDVCFEKIAGHYQATEKLGKVYIDPRFYRVAIPVNTSASGKGIDVPATGTRLPITGTKIRSFVHWEGVRDIDSSVVLEHADGKLNCINYTNYSYRNYEGAARFSGDVTSSNGTEYFDLDLEALNKQGVKRVVFTFHGFGSTLNAGKIYCGYQNKKNFNTKAWDPKNIELKIHVKGDKRAYVAFAVDIESLEIIVLNLMRDEDSLVVRPKDFEAVAAFMDPAKLELNMGIIASWRGEVVENPAEADYVFADDYTTPINLQDENGEPKVQTVIRSFDIEKLNEIASV
jgi:hypothetical protein